VAGILTWFEISPPYSVEVKPRKELSTSSAGVRLNFLKDRKYSAGLLRLRVNI